VAEIPDVGQVALDQCTVNNALNVVQLFVLVAILRWVRSDGKPPTRS
jgi:hypothetical protein